MKLKILSYEFDLIFEKGFADNKSGNNIRGLLGHIDYSNHQIKIDSGHPEEQGILLHEILHGVANYFSVDLSEKDVERLSEGLYCVLKQNGMLNDFPKGENE